MDEILWYDYSSEASSMLLLLVLVLRFLSLWLNCSDVTIQKKILHQYYHMVLYGLLLSVLEYVICDFCFASLRVKLRSI